MGNSLWDWSLTTNEVYWSARWKTMLGFEEAEIGSSPDDSSLSYLQRLHVDTVKIDRSFVSRIGLERNGSEMVGAIVALSHNLGMDVVAEGVETLEQVAQLQKLGCEYAKGFYFATAVDAATADGLIASQPWRGRNEPVAPTLRSARCWPA